jgi:hypothetical protein
MEFEDKTSTIEIDKCKPAHQILPDYRLEQEVFFFLKTKKGADKRIALRSGVITGICMNSFKNEEVEVFTIYSIRLNNSGNYIELSESVLFESKGLAILWFEKFQAIRRHGILENYSFTFAGDF